MLRSANTMFINLKKIILRRRYFVFCFNYPSYVSELLPYLKKSRHGQILESLDKNG